MGPSLTQISPDFNGALWICSRQRCLIIWLSSWQLSCMENSTENRYSLQPTPDLRVWYKSWILRNVKSSWSHTVMKRQKKRVFCNDSGTYCMLYMLSTQATLVKQIPFISFHNMVKSNFWHRKVRIISAALWNWLPRTSTETSKCYLRSNLNHWCGDAGAGYVSLMWKDKLSQHWQCTEQPWTILRLLQRRREMEVCFHVLLLAPFQPSDKDIRTCIWMPHEHAPPEHNQEGLMGISWDPGKWTNAWGTGR